MKKRFLGIICLLYSAIILWVWVSDNLKNFLAPSMQIYIKLAFLPFLILGLVMIFNNKIPYQFKKSDIIFILPLIFLIFSGDGRLTSSFATNRIINFNAENRVQLEENEVSKEKEELEQEQPKEEELKEEYDFSNPYFVIEDANYNELSNYITFEERASKFEGKTIVVRGFVINDVSFLSEEYVAIGKYTISCCVADAEFTGFVVKYDGDKMEENKWYEVKGILEKGKDKDGYNIMYIKVIYLDEIDSSKEEQYIYPCYAYDDGICEAVSKYNLE